MSKSSLDKLNFRLTLEQVQAMSPEQQNGVRRSIQTDLRFLCNCILRPRNKKFIPYKETVHGRIIDALPHCDPDKDILEWDNRDEFIVMASRGILKSTIGMAFLTQVILCAPDVRILIMSGKIDKAQSILEGARRPFMTNEVIRFLFPEWNVDPDDTTVEEFICPKRDPDLDVLRDPTMSLASFDSVKAGGHYELILLDDATNEQNSNNVENCLKTHGTYDDIDELMEPGGYRVFLATKWHEEDLPAYIKKEADEEKEITGVETLSYFVLPVWTLKKGATPKEDEAIKLREKNGQLMPADVELVWPEKLNAKFLFKKYRKNRADFYKQYLLDASLDNTAYSFPDDVLNRQITSPTDLESVPFYDRAVVVHWDLAGAFTGRRPKSESDFSCGMIAVFQCSTMKVWVVQSVLAHFNNSTDVANAVVSLYETAQYYGEIVGHSMEDAAGARYCQDMIDIVAKQKKIQMRPIVWELPDNDRKAKNVRISVLASAMRDGNVFLMANINFLHDIRQQFEKWTMDAKRRKDDGPDTLAQIWRTYRSMVMPKMVDSMKPGEPIVTWEPEIPVAPEDDPEANLEREQEAIAVEEANLTFRPY